MSFLKIMENQSRFIWFFTSRKKTMIFYVIILIKSGFCKIFLEKAYHELPKE